MKKHMYAYEFTVYLDISKTITTFIRLLIIWHIITALSSKLCFIIVAYVG